MSALARKLDPARSLTTAVGWLAAALSLSIAMLTVWISNLLSENLLSARDATLLAGVEALTTELEAALGKRLRALEALGASLPPLPAQDAGPNPAIGQSLRALKDAQPELQWIGILDTEGRLVAHTDASAESPHAGAVAWTKRCHEGAWCGGLQRDTFIGLCTPIIDGQGRLVAVAAALLERSWLAALGAEARQRLKIDHRARALVLDDRHRVLLDTVGHPATPVPAEGVTGSPFWTPEVVSVQQLDDAKRHVVLKGRPETGATLHKLGLQVLLMQPAEAAFWQGGINQQRIAWVVLGLSAVAAWVGIAFARRLTRRLTNLTAALRDVGTNPHKQIEPPPGKDEVSELGRAFCSLLRSLRLERDALDSLTSDLELRVQARTREVEQLAADGRYAAVVRERLRLARDLHDTLAHSMMAMLVEVRMLRKLHVHDPEALPEELERAEQLAHDGLNEARDAIGQMRLNVVRDLGLGPAMSSAIGRLADRTGLDIAYRSDPRAWSFADERAEVVFRIAEEALRNVVRHAGASHVDVILRDCEDALIELTVADDGMGFDADSLHPGHYGVVGMKEQALLIDGEISITSKAGRGTTLRLRLRAGPSLKT
jgi:signal transduction histidine kinase